jgi:FMN phosphatase YigB (HAD superfamily)
MRTRKHTHSEHITCILFDNNGVLTTSHRENVDADLAAFAGVTERAMRRAVIKHAPPCELGKVDDLEFARRILRTLKSTVDPKKFHAYRMTLYHPKWGMQRLAATLSKDYVTGMLSNVGSSFWDENTRWNPRGIFEKRLFLSYSMHMRKPQRQIYIAAAKRLKIPPHQILFIDDNLENVRGARKAGVHAILFKDILSLKQRLKTFGIKAR